MVAIEPAPEHVDSLRRNFRREIESGLVIVVEKGVWDRDGTLAFVKDSANSAADAFVPPDKTPPAGAVQLPVTTIDAIVKSLGLSRVDFIKMDIEGSERYALKGAATTLRSFKPRLAICTYHKPDDPDVLPAVILSANSQYSWGCGSCLFLWDGWRIVPQVMFFR